MATGARLRRGPQKRADPEPGTIVWPNGADLDPDVLYALMADEPRPFFEPAAPIKPRQ
jgi:hypothetical protein